MVAGTIKQAVEAVYRAFNVWAEQHSIDHQEEDDRKLLRDMVIFYLNKLNEDPQYEEDLERIKNIVINHSLEKIRRILAESKTKGYLDAHFVLRKEKEIAVAHDLSFLPYESPCQNLHGHNLKIAVEVSSQYLNREGMVCDAQIIGDIIKKLDHTNINNHPWFEGDKFERKPLPTTMENIAQVIAGKVFDSVITQGIGVGLPSMVAVEVSETAGNSVRYEMGNFDV